MKGIGRTVKRRRLEYKTDYKARLKLLESSRLRLVVRKTNRYIILQVVGSKGGKDHVITAATSKELLAHGWPEKLAGSLKSLPAAYLTGLLVASKAKTHEVSEVILDMGMYRNVKKGRIYAALRGVVDGELKVAHNPSILPDDKRLEHNQKTREAFTSVREKMKHGRKGNKK